MPNADLFIAAKHCEAMRDLVVIQPGGRKDDASLSRIRQLARAAASAADDADCKDLGETIIHFATHLFSASGHEEFAYGQTSGADVLRLRILREIQALRDRLSYLEVMRTSAAQHDHSADHGALNAR